MEPAAESPRLSVVVPVYNNADYLRPLLDALAAQTWEGDWELIVADNGSTDGSVELVESYRDALPCIRMLESTPRGTSHARNTGAKAARSELLVLLDADDVPAPDYLEKIAAALADHDFVCGRLDVERLNPHWTRAFRPSPQEQGPGDDWRFLPASYGAAMAMRRAVFEQVGGFDESFATCGDLDFCWRAQLAGTPLVFAEDAVVHYRYRASLSDLFAQGRRYGRSEVIVYARYARHGVPPVPARRSLDRVRALARHRRRLLSRPGRAWWLNQAGFFVGRLEGSVAERTLLLQ